MSGGIDAAVWLPLVFMGLMALAMLIYVVLDGYDLGVGVLLPFARPEDRDLAIAAIGPFWDANETWLVLGVGLLLVAFPMAHGVILGALYLPVALMLIGLILRGVAFDFRYKAGAEHKPLWDRVFHGGSLLASFAQGWMLGHYITGFAPGWGAHAFALLIGVCLCAGYALLGAGWLLIKADGPLQAAAVGWARKALIGTAVGVAAVSLATPLVSPTIFAKWFQLPGLIALLPIPLATAALFVMAWVFLRRLGQDAVNDNQRGLDRWAWAPFACAVGIFVLAFFGLAYSLYPYLVIDRIDIWQAASSPESLAIILVGAGVTLPVILGYTVYAYRVFWGKAHGHAYGL